MLNSFGEQITWLPPTLTAAQHTAQLVKILLDCQYVCCQGVSNMHCLFKSLLFINDEDVIEKPHILLITPPPITTLKRVLSSVYWLEVGCNYKKYNNFNTSTKMNMKWYFSTKCVKAVQFLTCTSNWRQQIITSNLDCNYRFDKIWL